jgi:hypothetical protein
MGDHFGSGAWSEKRPELQLPRMKPAAAKEDAQKASASQAASPARPNVRLLRCLAEFLVQLAQRAKRLGRRVKTVEVQSCCFWVLMSSQSAIFWPRLPFLAMVAAIAPLERS